LKIGRKTPAAGMATYLNTLRNFWVMLDGVDLCIRYIKELPRRGAPTVYYKVSTRIWEAAPW